MVLQVSVAGKDHDRGGGNIAALPGLTSSTGCGAIRDSPFVTVDQKTVGRVIDTVRDLVAHWCVVPLSCGGGGGGPGNKTVVCTTLFHGAGCVLDVEIIGSDCILGPPVQFAEKNGISQWVLCQSIGVLTTCGQTNASCHRKILTPFNFWPHLVLAKGMPSHSSYILVMGPLLNHNWYQRRLCHTKPGISQSFLAYPPHDGVLACGPVYVRKAAFSLL